MRKLIYSAAAALTAAAILVPAASAWNANVWASPSRNLVCAWYPNYDAIMCISIATKDGATVKVHGGSRHAWPVHFNGAGIANPYAVPVLQYGQTWTIPNARCTMSVTGVRCENSAGHGFILSRGGKQTF